MKIGINGFGRIGRCVLRLVLDDPSVEEVVINGLSDTKELAYLFKYDSMQRFLPYEVEAEENYINVNDRKIKVYKESDPNNIPWGEHGIDVVFECTGVFNSSEKSMAHINKGAKHVLISAPSKDDTKTIVYGVNDELITKEDKIISCASCTTNALAPLASVIHKNFKIKSGFMTTVHAMTNDQETLDVTHKKGIYQRRGRAASLNIIPTSTGAASQIGKVIPELDGLLDGISYRVPVGDGSLVELNVVVEKSATKEEINNVLKVSENEAFKYTEDPIVSSDVVGNVYGSIVDGLLTNVINKNGNVVVKVVAWYDNEIGYSAQMIRVAKTLMSFYEEEKENIPIEELKQESFNKIEENITENKTIETNITNQVVNNEVLNAQVPNDNLEKTTEIINLNHIQNETKPNTFEF